MLHTLIQDAKAVAVQDKTSSKSEIIFLGIAFRICRSQRSHHISS